MKGFNSFLTVWQDDGWHTLGTLNPFVPALDSDNLQVNRIVTERENQIRNSRSHMNDSPIYEESKAQGGFSFCPRLTELPGILYSHFQMRDYQDTGSSHRNEFTPSKQNPLWSTGQLYGTGTYGSPPGDVFSMSMAKKYFPTDAYDTNTVFFERGVCDKISFEFNANEDFKVNTHFQFKGSVEDYWEGTISETDVGSYSTGSFLQWFEGTFSGGLTGEDIKSLMINCSNNLLEKKTVGKGGREFFEFGNYTVEGSFDTWIEDLGWYEKLNGGAGFSIHGTLFQDATNYMTISMPNCKVMPHETAFASANEEIVSKVIFKAYDKNGTAPIKIGVMTTNFVDLDETTVYDAGLGARTVGNFDLGDAALGARVLGDYDLADRDA